MTGARNMTGAAVMHALYLWNNEDSLEGRNC